MTNTGKYRFNFWELLKSFPKPDFYQPQFLIFSNNI